jgi:hypothetical protein
MAKAAKRLFICLDNAGYEVSLERRKIYVALPDAKAERSGILGSSMSPAKIIYIRPSASSPQSYPFRLDVPSCTPPNNRFERSRAAPSLGQGMGR